VKTVVGSVRWVDESFATVWEESRKKFDDAIYRARTGETETAEKLWKSLEEAQESNTDGLVSGLQCTGILNQLARRGQVPTNW
jgi:hypothetical protein